MRIQNTIVHRINIHFNRFSSSALLVVLFFFFPFFFVLPIFFSLIFLSAWKPTIRCEIHPNNLSINSHSLPLRVLFVMQFMMHENHSKSFACDNSDRTFLSHAGWWTDDETKNEQSARTREIETNRKEQMHKKKCYVTVSIANCKNYGQSTPQSMQLYIYTPIWHQ